MLLLTSQERKQQAYRLCKTEYA